MIPIMKELFMEFYGETPELSPDYCRIVSSSHFSRLSSMMAATKGKIVVGGASSEKTRFMELTVLTGVGWDDATMQVVITKKEEKKELLSLCFKKRKKYLVLFCPLSTLTPLKKQSR